MSATAFEDFVAALSRGDMVAMRAVVEGNQDELVRDFYLLLREAGSILDRSPYDPEERNKARLLVFAAAQLAQTFDDVGPGQDVLVRLIRNSPLLTVTVRSEVDSDAALARYLSQRTADLAGSGGAASLARDLLSLFEAAAEPPEARLRRMQEEYEARARQEMEAAIAEQRRQRELRELVRRVGRLRQAHDADGLQAIATDGSLPVLVRRSAVRFLGEIGSPRAAVSLGPLLHDAELQEDVVKALVALGTEEAAAALAARLDAEPIATRALTALVEIGEPHAVQPLIRKLRDSHTRDRAAAALSTIWGSQARERWLELVRHEPQPAGRRLLATCALLSAGDAAAVPPLAGYLSDGPLEPALLHKLGELGGPPAIAILIRQLDESGAAAAGEVLGHLGAPAFSALLRRSEQPGSGGRIAAETLAVTGYKPRSPQEEARLLLVRGERLGLIRRALTTLPVLTSAARGSDAETAATARSVLAMEAGLLFTVLTLGVLWLRRRWIWPGAEVVLPPGGWTRLPGAVRPWLWRRRDAGTVLWTAWAHSFLGRRQPIKVEVFAPVEPEASPSKVLGTPLDILVAVGISVRPGTYVAASPGGSVRVRVQASR